MFLTIIVKLFDFGRTFHYTASLFLGTLFFIIFIICFFYYMNLARDVVINFPCKISTLLNTMSEFYTLTTPFSENTIEKLRSGDHIELTGTIYTARDAAHKRLIESLDRGEELPVELKGQVIYYAGPAPAKPGKPIGPVGPTTSCRMDSYAPRLMQEGLKGMIGKGSRSKEVLEAIKKYKCVYFAAIGGAAAVIANSVKAAEVIAYEDLGPEAIRKLTVEKFQAVVINDIYGNDLYEEGKQKYSKGTT